MIGGHLFLLFKHVTDTCDCAFKEAVTILFSYWGVFLSLRGSFFLVLVQ